MIESEMVAELYHYKALCWLLLVALCVVCLIAIAQSMYIDKYKRDHWWR